MLNMKLLVVVVVMSATAVHGYVIQPPGAAATPVGAYDYDDDSAAAYRYLYTVADSLSGASFNVGEERDGDLTAGSYSVALPDGRVQTVNYRVTADSGYVADVSYTGEAHYPPQAEQKKAVVVAAPAAAVVPVSAVPAKASPAASGGYFVPSYGPAPVRVQAPAPLILPAPLPVPAER